MAASNEQLGTLRLVWFLYIPFDLIHILSIESLVSFYTHSEWEASELHLKRLRFRRSGRRTSIALQSTEPDFRFLKTKLLSFYTICILFVLLFYIFMIIIRITFMFNSKLLVCASAIAFCPRIASTGKPQWNCKRQANKVMCIKSAHPFVLLSH